MKKIIISIAIFAASVFSAAAQNLDPTVEVSRGYQGRQEGDSVSVLLECRCGIYNTSDS